MYLDSAKRVNITDEVDYVLDILLHGLAGVCVVSFDFGKCVTLEVVRYDGWDKCSTNILKNELEKHHNCFIWNDALELQGLNQLENYCSCHNITISILVYDSDAGVAEFQQMLIE